jgi:multiple sugar transport system permease protein
LNRPLALGRPGLAPAWQGPWRRTLERSFWGYLFLLPVLLGFAIFLFVPVVWSLWLSFTNTGLVDSEWAGLDNYRSLLHSSLFWQTLRTTALYTTVVVAEAVLASMILAALIQGIGSRRLATFFRAAFFLPAVTTPVVIALVWRWIFNTQWGLLNYLLGLLHLGPVKWLADPSIALWSVILSTVLTVPAFGVVTFSASIGSIPGELYEAADLDGAGPISKWWRVTVPLLKPTILFVGVIYTISAFQVFDRIYIMTSGGPGFATTPIVMLIYNTGISNWHFGLASAQAVVLFAIIALVSLVQFRLLRSDFEY